MSNDSCGQAPPETNEQRSERLMRFYDCESMDDLVKAMEHHIEKLQSKLPRPPLMVTQKVREG